MKEIKLTQGKVALVDDEDYEELSAFNWHAFRCGNTFYAQCYIKLPNGREAMQLMHRQILGLAHGDKLQVDHKDRNSLNNTRENLHVATAAQNGANKGKQRSNKSGFKGVSWDRCRQKWQAGTRHNGKQFHLGRFDNPQLAYGVFCLIAAAILIERERQTIERELRESPRNNQRLRHDLEIFIKDCQSELEFLDAARGPLPPEGASRKQRIELLIASARRQLSLL
jgi:hypothetical protein